MTRTIYIEIDGLDEKPELEVPDNEDFLPIVKINKKEVAVNAIYSIEDCTKCTKSKLNLGEDFDEDLRNYIIAEVVIAKNSKSYIPLKTVQGYNGWGYQDGDGILEFKCSNKDVTFRLLDESEPKDCKADTKVYDVTDAAMGDKYTLEISHKLERAAKFSIEVKASDDDDGLGGHSDKVVKCGKFNFTVLADKDVFLQDEKNRSVDENQNLVGNDSICFRVADKQLSKLLDNPQLVLSSYFNESSYTRMKQISAKGFIKEFKTFSPYKGLGYTIPEDFISGQNNILYKYFENSIGCKAGYHIYYFSVVKGNHVLTLIIDATEPCKKTFQIYDQIKIRNSYDLKEIDKEILSISNHIWDYVYSHSKNHNKSDIEIAIWKIQRK